MPSVSDYAAAFGNHRDTFSQLGAAAAGGIGGLGEGGLNQVAQMLKIKEYTSAQKARAAAAQTWAAFDAGNPLATAQKFLSGGNPEDAERALAFGDAQTKRDEAAKAREVLALKEFIQAAFTAGSRAKTPQEWDRVLDMAGQNPLIKPETVALYKGAANFARRDEILQGWADQFNAKDPTGEWALGKRKDGTWGTVANRPEKKVAPTVHSFTEGVDTVDKQWNPETNKWDELSKGPRTTAGMRIVSDGQGGFTYETGTAGGAGGGLQRPRITAIEAGRQKASEGLALIRDVKSRYKPEYQKIGTRAGL